eukprot:6471188-Amphidinium_carterae.1
MNEWNYGPPEGLEEQLDSLETIPPPIAACVPKFAKQTKFLAVPHLIPRGYSRAQDPDQCWTSGALGCAFEDWRAFELAPKSCRADPEIVLAAVRRQGLALKFAAESCRQDREIVLAAVKQNGLALKFAAESCRQDRDIVLAAVQHHGLALKVAAESCRGDRT